MDCLMRGGPFDSGEASSNSETVRGLYHVNGHQYKKMSALQRNLLSSN